MVKEFVWEKGAGWQAISPLLFSFLVLIKCQVLTLRVGRPRDQVLQRDFTISYSLEIQLLLCYNNNNNNNNNITTLYLYLILYILYVE